jgi:DNA polymerase-3 subunit delta
MLDAALAGNAREALVQLEQLLLAGEQPVGILAQISASLRRFAAAARLIERAESARRKVSLRQVLEEVGVKSFVLAKTEAQLRQVGRVRAQRLYRELLEADLALKGASSSPARARLVLEELIARLSTAAAPAATRVR